MWWVCTHTESPKHAHKSRSGFWWIQKDTQPNAAGLQFRFVNIHVKHVFRRHRSLYMHILYINKDPLIFSVSFAHTGAADRSHEMRLNWPTVFLMWMCYKNVVCDLFTVLSDLTDSIKGCCFRRIQDKLKKNKTPVDKRTYFFQ